MDNLLIVVVGVIGYLAIKSLDSVLAELKSIKALLSAIEERDRPPPPSSIEEWQARRDRK